MKTDIIIILWTYNLAIALCLISRAIIPSGNMISATTVRAAITPTIIITVKLEPDDSDTSDSDTSIQKQ